MEQGEESAPIRTLEAPTGLGKTLATLVGWLWDRQQRPQTTPRRLVYQLPLRTLTEQIAVECLAVMARLGVDIPVHVLRGGQIDNDYADALAAEAVIVGTLDQVVSRQLMRGYCCSRWSWPRHFAALNADVRVVVDETQLQGAAVRTAIRLQQLHQELGGPAPRELVLCSATLDAAILPAGTPPPWAERCRLRASRGGAEGGPIQTAHHGDRWEQLLLAGRAEEAMEMALHRLRVTDVVSWAWPAIAACDPEPATAGGEGAGTSAHPRAGEGWGVRGVGVSITGIRSSPPGMPGWMRAVNGLGAQGKLWQSPSATCSVLISCRSCAWQSRLSSYLPRCSGFGGPDHHHPNPGQPVAGVGQIGRPGARQAQGCGR